MQQSQLLLLLLVVFEVRAEVKCQAGWVSNDQFQKCYKFMPVPMSNVDAQQACLSLGSNLVSIKSVFEQQFVYTEAKKAYISDQFWLGANDLTVLNSWQWPDLTPLLYANWETGYPTSDVTARCALMEITKGKWINSDCSTYASFACEIKVQTGSTTTAAPETDWMYFADTGSEYKVLTMNDTWFGYEKRCEAQGAILSTIHSMSENNFIDNMLIYAPGCMYIALGLESISYTWMNFSWIDHSPMDFVNWNSCLFHGINCTTEDPDDPERRKIIVKDDDDDDGPPVLNYLCGFLSFYDTQWNYWKCDIYWDIICGVCKRPKAQL